MANESTLPGSKVGHAPTLPGDDVRNSVAASQADPNADFAAMLAEIAATPQVDVVAAGSVVPSGRIGNRYVVERKLGQGGMGVVYLARDERLDRSVAIKLCFDATSRSGGARISREARALAALTHPNVLEIYGVGRHRGALYIAMEYVDGGTAETWARKNPTPSWREILALYREAGEGLAAAHREGIVHRDFKPENVLVGRDGAARVADFGLARAWEEDSSSEHVPVLDDTIPGGDPRLTRAGSVVGTPAYMAPEQLFGLDVDARADQFSFCCSLFEALFRRRPFESKSAQARLYKMTREEMRAPDDRRGVPRWLVRVVLRGLRVSPEDRFASMPALLAALDAGPRRGRWIGAGGVAAGVAAGIALYSPADARCSTDGETGDLWSPQMRAEVEAQFETVSDAKELFEPVAAELDEYVAEWNIAYSAACTTSEAAHVAQFDENMSCLVRLRTGIRSTIAMLKDADGTVAVRALDMTRSFEPIDSCEQGKGPVTTGTSRAAERALQEDITEVRTHHLAGRWLSAARLSRAAVAEAREVGSSTLLADALLARAEVLRDAGRTAERTILLEEAYFVALDAGNEKVVGSSALELLDAHGMSSNSHLARALHWHAVAKAASERLGAEVLDPIELQVGYGKVLLTAERRDAAMVQLEEARDALDARGEGVSPLRVRVLAALVSLEVREEETVAAREQILAMAVEIWGDGHPRTAEALQRLAIACSHNGDTTRARILLLQAREAFERALGPNNNRLIDVYNKLGGQQSRAGDVEQAVRTYLAALKLAEEAAEPSARGLLNVHANLGSAYLALGRHTEAIEHLMHAMTISEESLGPTATKTAFSLINLAGAHMVSDDYEEAERSLVRALAILEESVDPGHRAFVVAGLNLALAQQNLGRPEEAVLTLESARRNAGGNPVDLGNIADAEGGLHGGNRNWAGAVKSFTRCAKIFEELHGVTHPQRIRCLSSLAAAELELGDVLRARMILERLLPHVNAPGASVRPTTFVNVHFHLARAVRDRDPDRAKALLRTGLDRASDDSSVELRRTSNEMTALLDELEST